MPHVPGSLYVMLKKMVNARKIFGQPVTTPEEDPRLARSTSPGKVGFYSSWLLGWRIWKLEVQCPSWILEETGLAYPGLSGPH